MQGYVRPFKYAFSYFLSHRKPISKSLQKSGSGLSITADKVRLRVYNFSFNVLVLFTIFESIQLKDMKNVLQEPLEFL